LLWRKWRDAFPYINFAVEVIIAKGSTVVAGWHLPSRHKSEYLGQHVTGNKIEADCISIDRINNGVVVSGFGAWGSFGFRD
jgi:predicted ester cyclase